MDPDWQVTCRQLYLGDELERWLALGTLLSNRVAWHFEVQDTMDPTLWCFGLAGEGRLVATLENSGGLHLYDHDNDDDYSFASINELVEWLDLHEAEHEGLSPLGRELMGDLLPGQIEERARNARRLLAEQRLAEPLAGGLRHPRHDVLVDRLRDGGGGVTEELGDYLG